MALQSIHTDLIQRHSQLHESVEVTKNACVDIVKILSAALVSDVVKDEEAKIVVKNAINDIKSNVIRRNIDSSLPNIAENPDISALNIIELCKHVSQLMKQVSQQVTSLKNYEAEIDRLSQEINNLDQYNRKENAVFEYFPLPVYKLSPVDFIYYVVDCLNNYLPFLHQPLTVYDIEDAHPLHTKSKNPPIIIRFKNRWKRNEIFAHKGYLQNYYNITIKEQLTPKNRKLFSSAERLFGPENVWSNKGRIFVATNSKNHIVRSEKELYMLVEEVDVNNEFCPLRRPSSKSKMKRPVATRPMFTKTSPRYNSWNNKNYYINNHSIQQHHNNGMHQINWQALPSNDTSNSLNFSYPAEPSSNASYAQPHANNTTNNNQLNWQALPDATQFPTLDVNLTEPNSSSSNITYSQSQAYHNRNRKTTSNTTLLYGGGFRR